MLKDSVSQNKPSTYFNNHPGSYYVELFKKHLAKTGDPTTWIYHTHTKPPVDAEFLVLCDVEIPPLLRKKVGMARCPICSPNSPKYFSGNLVWFPDEGVIRAIGIECSKKHFGAEATNRERSTRLADERRSLAQDFLLERLHKLAHWKKYAEQSIPVARELDKFRNAVWKAAGKDEWKNLIKQSADGKLKLYKKIQVPKTDKYGETKMVSELTENGYIKINGLNFLKKSPSIEAKAKNAFEAFKRVHATSNEEETLEFITNTLDRDDYLFEVEKLTKAAIEDIDELRKIRVEAKAFYKPENLMKLSDWASNKGANTQIVFKYNTAYRNRVKVGKKSVDYFTGTKLIFIPTFDN